MIESHAREMLADLSRHYGVRVAPVSEVCGALRDWRNAMAEEGEHESLVAALDSVQAAVWKSNYLARRIYGGEAHRVQKCPIHKGHWSGCAFGDRVCPHCMSGSNVTGWLPNA